MKHLLTLTALLTSSWAMGQNDPFWNPDANGDDLIGATDLASFLSVYNTNVGVDSSVTCDFDGTTWEQLVLDVLNEVAIIDSVYFEYTLSGAITEYILGCPDPILTPWTISRSGVSTEPEITIDIGSENGSSDYRNFWCRLGPDSLYAYMFFYTYSFSGGLNDPYEFDGSLSANFFTPPYQGGTSLDLLDGDNIPVQDANLVFDSLGLHVDSFNFNPENFVRAIPFWHYTE